MKITALIPAYNPEPELKTIVSDLLKCGFERVVVVNDGSAVKSREIFHDLTHDNRVILLEHAVNLGKGAALKTGLNYIYCNAGDHTGVVTLDADGQHLIEDAVKVANTLSIHPDCLVLGARGFNKNVPMRSKIGNALTKYLFRLLTGIRLTDTQTGLRGIKKGYIPTLLKINSNGYEFELDMLLACKYTGIKIIEETITTVYKDGNKSSYFNPIIDSMKIYFVLFRFSITSIISAVIDNFIFILFFGIGFNIISCQAASRVLATIFNYFAVKRVVFYSNKSDSNTLPKYILLVLVSGIVSYLLIVFINSKFSIPIIAAKLISESAIFIANFAIQRDFIFSGRDNTKKQATT